MYIPLCVNGGGVAVEQLSKFQYHFLGVPTLCICLSEMAALIVNCSTSSLTTESTSWYDKDR